MPCTSMFLGPVGPKRESSMHLKHWMKVYLGLGVAYAGYSWYKASPGSYGLTAGVKDVALWPLRLAGVA